MKRWHIYRDFTQKDTNSKVNPKDQMNTDKRRDKTPKCKSQGVIEGEVTTNKTLRVGVFNESIMRSHKQQTIWNDLGDTSTTEKPKKKDENRTQSK
jgi:hypothetical protein